jgi:DMSO/TMAO reductase YedYZ molybdopterin-dependent catalytic subunit
MIRSRLTAGRSCHLPNANNVLFSNERKKQQQTLRDAGRLPPGQSLTLKWPVLHEGAAPSFDPAKWDLTVRGLVENPLRLTWQEFKALPRTRVQSDFHCVTSWSKFDNEWEGVLFRVIAERAKPTPEARFVMVHGEGGYTTNVPLGDLMRDDVLLADTHAPEPLTADHGAPLRLVVPHLYAWKSAKWLRGFEFMAEDRAGFWEQVGYHMYGDPFREQRYRE